MSRRVIVKSNEWKKLSKKAQNKNTNLCIIIVKEDVQDYDWENVNDSCALLYLCNWQVSNSSG